MRAFAILLLATGFALAALPASAQETGSTSFTLHSALQGADYIWKNDAGATNPELVVPASQSVTVTIRQAAESDGIPHNIQVGSGDVSDQITATDDEATYTFTAPESGTVEYRCTIHPVSMKGTVRVAGSATTGGDGGNDAPGLGLLGLGLAAVGATLLVRRRA